MILVLIIILLHINSSSTWLIILESHDNLHNCGLENTLDIIRCDYWIINPFSPTKFVKLHFSDFNNSTNWESLERLLNIFLKNVAVKVIIVFNVFEIFLFERRLVL